MKLQYKNNKLANFSMKSSITVDTNPEDVFLEISLDNADNKRIKSMISQLRPDQLDEIVRSANQWIKTKPASSDELAVIDGAKKFMKVCGNKSFSKIANFGTHFVSLDEDNYLSISQIPMKDSRSYKLRGSFEDALSFARLLKKFIIAVRFKADLEISKTGNELIKLGKKLNAKLVSGLQDEAQEELDKILSGNKSFSKIVDKFKRKID